MKAQPKNSIVKFGAVIAKLSGCGLFVIYLCGLACDGSNHDPVANPEGPYNGSVGTALTFDGSGSSDPDNDPLTLTWTFGDGTPTATGKTPTHTYSTAGTFTIMLTANDGKGGVNSKSTTATIAPPPNPSDLSKTTFSKSDSKSWASVGGMNLSYATDSGSSTTRWKFNRVGGFASSVGWVESVEFPGKCLSANGVQKRSQVVLAPCNSTDQNQQWNAIQMQMSGGKAFYSFVNNATQWCLTEGSNSQVILDDYNVRDTQLWAVRYNGTNQFEGDQTPWYDQ